MVGQDITGQSTQTYVDGGEYPCRILRYRGRDMQEIARLESQNESYRVVLPWDVIVNVNDTITIDGVVYSVSRIVDGMTDRISVDLIVTRER